MSLIPILRDISFSLILDRKSAFLIGYSSVLDISGGTSLVTSIKSEDILGDFSDDRKAIEGDVVQVGEYFNEILEDEVVSSG